MADDRMKNDDINRQAGNKGDRDMEKQSPGRNPQNDRSAGQRSGEDLDNEDVDDGSHKGGQGSMGQKH